MPKALKDSTSIGGAHNLPLAMLATGFDLRAGRSAEISGFLCFSGAVPVDLEARRNFT